MQPAWVLLFTTGLTVVQVKRLLNHSHPHNNAIAYT
jgi:hypothetical protein